MNTPFIGQYLASLEVNGQHGHLTINVDSDRQGQGLAYLILYNNDPQSFLIFDCWLNESDGVISGTVKRSLRLEALHNKNTEAPKDEPHSISIQLFKNETPHRLVYVDENGQQELLLQPVTSDVHAETTHIATWKDFKAWVESIRAKDAKAIFRGVPKARYGLKTSFHRTGRVDLERYRDIDFPIFRDLAETIGGLKFSFEPDDNGALWGFAQHHGFPTPLLDWTESPYIAAYFAFSDRLQHQGDQSDLVKIYCLNGRFVESQRPLNLQIADVFPRVWVFRPRSKGNQRLIFQQGQFLLSNVIEIEAYLMSLPHQGDLPLISAVEMPASLASEVIDELAYMGVSHLSLFPGLDGAARHATFKQFYRPT